MLKILLQQVDIHFQRINQPYLNILYKTLFLTMYFGLLRVSEVTSGGHPILAKDVQIAANKKKFLLILRTSKTYWKNSKPQLIKILSTCANITGHNKRSD